MIDEQGEDVGRIDDADNDTADQDCPLRTSSRTSSRQELPYGHHGKAQSDDDRHDEQRQIELSGKTLTAEEVEDIDLAVAWWRETVRVQERVADDGARNAHGHRGGIRGHDERPHRRSTKDASSGSRKVEHDRPEQRGPDHPQAPDDGRSALPADPVGRQPGDAGEDRQRTDGGRGSQGGRDEPAAEERAYRPRGANVSGTGMQFMSDSLRVSGVATSTRFSKNTTQPRATSRGEFFSDSAGADSSPPRRTTCHGARPAVRGVACGRYAH